MVEKSHTGKRHRHSVFITSLNDIFIPERAAWLRNVLDSTARRAIYIVSERNESIGAERDIVQAAEPFLFFLGRQPGGNFFEYFSPDFLLLGG